jgi:HK97 family phage prohead protease
MEKKIVQHFQMNFKEVTTTESGSIKIKGFASTPDIDRYDDIIRPEAYANAMATYMKNPVVLLGHDSNKPIGLVTEYNLTINGLEVTCEITNNEENCFEKIQNKTLRGFSIGWICNSCVFRDDGTRTIREVTALDLIEISVVATPANPNTLFTLAKSLKKMFAELKEVEAETTDDVVTDVVEEVIEETPEAPAPIE